MIRHPLLAATLDVAPDLILDAADLATATPLEQVLILLRMAGRIWAARLPRLDSPSGGRTNKPPR